MVKVLIVIDIILILLDIAVYIRFRKICKEKSVGEEIEAKYIRSHSIAMVVISMLMLGINLILSIYNVL